MAHNPTTVLSQTLQSLTSVKFSEIAKQRDAHASFTSAARATAAGKPSVRDRVAALLDALAPTTILAQDGGREVADIRRLLQLAEYDSSVPESHLVVFEGRIRGAMDARGRSLDFAHLYARLLNEWIDGSGKRIDDREGDGEGVGVSSVREEGEGEGFALVESDRLQALRDKFAAVVFTPVRTDEGEIDRYLRGMFKGDEGEKTLDIVRGEIRAKGEEFAKMVKPFDVHTIRQCIKGLFSEELLKDEKKTILQEFEKNDTVLNEMADVLNLRFADLRNWTWDAPNGLPVEPRRQLNGKYRVMADEEVLQAIFLHFIAMHWAVRFKTLLSDLIRVRTTYPGVWEEMSTVPLDDLDRREYFTGSRTPNTSVQSEKTKQFNDFFLANLPDSLDDEAEPYDDASKQDDSSSEGEKSSPIKQQILRRLAADITLGKNVNGEVAALQGDLQWFAPGLPHSTILAVLRFYGVPEFWLEFFSKFLRAPLNMSAGLDGTAGQVQVRERGTPIASAMAVFLGELVLFGMDLAVNDASGLLLYRLHDDFWTSGKPDKVVEAWKAINIYVKVMGLELNAHKCGAKYLSDGPRDPAIDEALPKGNVGIGFLNLDGDTGAWVIDQENVSAHIKQLRIQLSSCTSIFSWVSTWNSAIGRFFTSSFGEPAECFGRSHLDNILATHRRIQAELLADTEGGSQSVNDYLRNVIARRFDIDLASIPNAFLFLPQAMGGMGLKNPFVPLFMLRDNISNEPSDAVQRFFDLERDHYKVYKRDFEAMSERDKRKRMFKIWGGDSKNTKAPQTSEPFMTFEEFTAYRDVLSNDLGGIYQFLLRVPHKQNLQSQNLYEPKLNPEELWIANMYNHELKEMFGGSRIVSEDLLPLGVLEMMNKRRVYWSMRL